MKKQLKTVLAPLIVVLTVAAFTYYLVNHPETTRQLTHLSLGALLALLGLYVLAFGALIMLTRGSLRFYGKTMSAQENMLFNAYSSLVNFFGPGQSGPIFRGAYLKKRHNLAVKQYVFVTLLYYGFFAVISAMLMVVGWLAWWQTVLLMSAVAIVSFGVITYYKRRSRIDTAGMLSVRAVAWIFGATVLQVALMAIIYGIELRSVGTHVSISQVLAYTGVANFALFVALTPGAIGIREGFLVFSQNLHHIDRGSIVAANVLDRGVYLLLLGLLFVVVIGLHAKDKLHVAQLTAEPPKKA